MMSLPKFDPSRAEAAGKIFTYTDFNSEANTMCIKIVEGRFKDVIYYYKRVKVEPVPDLPDGDAALTFEYQIHDVPESIKVEELTPDDHREFEVLIGDILVNIIQDNILNESRKDDSQSSTAQ